MVWSGFEATWQRRLATATAFATREGHLRPREGHREGGIDLYKWLVTQRAAYRNGKLPADKVAALTRLGMPWTPVSRLHPSNPDRRRHQMTPPGSITERAADPSRTAPAPDPRSD
jgi:hypothetical protein